MLVKTHIPVLQLLNPQFWATIFQGYKYKLFKNSKEKYVWEVILNEK